MGQKAVKQCQFLIPQGELGRGELLAQVGTDWKIMMTITTTMSILIWRCKNEAGAEKRKGWGGGPCGVGGGSKVATRWKTCIRKFAKLLPSPPPSPCVTLYSYIGVGWQT